MDDVALARSLVQDIGGAGRVGATIYEAYKLLRKMFPHEDEPQKQWTESRLKAWWYGESDRVMHFQMAEMYEAARKAKATRDALKAERKEHAEFIAKTARLAALLEHQDQAFHRDQIAALRQQSRRMGMPRDDGDR